MRPYGCILSCVIHPMPFRQQKWQFPFQKSYFLAAKSHKVASHQSFSLSCNASISSQTELPLKFLDNPDRPLRSRLLQVPQYRQRYLDYVAQIAREDLDWDTLGPFVEKLQEQVAPLVEIDTRKLSSTEAFKNAVSSDESTASRLSNQNLRFFAKTRREYLLKK